MRSQGKITKWHDDKGFGFIRDAGNNNEIFMHMSEIHVLNKRPTVNESVTYDLTQDEQGRFRAVNVDYLIDDGGHLASKKSTPFSTVFLTFTLLFTAFVFERSSKGFLPNLFPYLFIGINLIAFLFYYYDKRSAIKNNWRTQESTLHCLSLLGGWGGAYFAQILFKHKYKKESFMMMFKITIFLNCLIIIFYSVPKLSKILGAYLLH